MLSEPPGTDRSQDDQVQSKCPRREAEAPSDEWASLSFTRAIPSTLTRLPRQMKGSQARKAIPRFSLCQIPDVMIVDSSLAYSCPVIFWRRHSIVSEQVGLAEKIAACTTYAPLVGLKLLAFWPRNRLKSTVALGSPGSTAPASW